MKTWNWDEIECEIHEGAADPDNECGWDLEKTHPNGVREYRSDRNHAGLEVEADSEEAAAAMFYAASEDYREMLKG